MNRAKNFLKLFEQEPAKPAKYTPVKGDKVKYIGKERPGMKQGYTGVVQSTYNARTLGKPPTAVVAKVKVDQTGEVQTAWQMELEKV